MVVYLDTNVYYGAKFVFDRGKFETLKKYINTGVVKLLYTNATVGEVFRRMEDIESEIIVYNRTIRKNLEKFKIAEDLSIAEISAADLIEDRKSKLRELLSLPGVECVSLNPIDAERLMNDYFQQLPPFECQKPYEFKDAIMINAIRNYQQQSTDLICIVSDDDGFRKAFEGNVNFCCFKYIGEFFKYVQEQTELNAYYVNFVQNGFFQKEVLYYLNNLDIDRSGYSEWECIDKAFFDVDFELLYVERGEEDNQLLLHIFADYKIWAEITHRDEDVSYYDREEGRYLVEEYVTWKEYHTYCEDLIVVCEIINDGESFNFTRVVSDRKYQYMDLSDETMYEFDEISKSQIEEPDLVYCSQCGTIVGTAVSYFDYQDNPLCKQCAVCDSDGLICSLCGKKIPYEYTVSGFCEKCFSDN